MASDSPSFSAIPDLGLAHYDPNHNEYVMEAFYGFPSADPTEAMFYPEPILSMPNNLGGFSEQYQVQPDQISSPGSISSLSLPLSPFSLLDDLSDPDIVDPPLPYNPNSSPTELSVLTPLIDADDTKPAKTKIDLEGIEFNPANRKWICTKCGGDFVSSHEARRHAKTAAKCTGKKVKCLRCGERVHAENYSRKRHFGSKKCQKKGRKKGAVAYTVNNAYVDS